MKKLGMYEKVTKKPKHFAAIDWSSFSGKGASHTKFMFS